MRARSLVPVVARRRRDRRARLRGRLERCGADRHALARCGRHGDRRRGGAGERRRQGRAAEARSARFQAPVYVTSPPGDRKRLFVVEQGGRIRVLVNGKARARPFLDISGKVRAGGEQGLLSMAFAPDYARSGRFYVDYTDTNGDSRIVEYRRASRTRAEPGLRAPADLPAPARGEPQRGAAALRPRPQALHRLRRRRGRRGPARRARQRAEPGHAARQDPAHRSAPLGRPPLHDPEEQPVRRPRRRAQGDLGLRPAQPVAVHLRPGRRSW